MKTRDMFGIALLLLTIVILLIYNWKVAIPELIGKQDKGECLYIFDPKPDITAFEIAKMLPYYRTPYVLYVHKAPDLSEQDWFNDVKRHFRKSDGCKE